MTAQNPEIVGIPDGHVLGYPVPRTFVARAGGKGKRSTTLDEMCTYDNGLYMNAFVRNTPQYFNLYHSIALAKDALACNDYHTDEGEQWDFAKLGYDDDKVESLKMEQ